jgi:signal transduction histidine kinase
MVAALYGGLRAGVLATLLSAAVADYFWIEPVGSFAMTRPIDWLALGIFIATSLMVSWLAERLWRTRDELERRVGERTEALKAATIAAEQANEAKSRFLAATSHDLRQPFQALRLYMDVLIARIEAPEARRVLLAASQALANGEDLLRALLDLSQLEIGAIAVQRRTFPLSELMLPLVGECEGIARQKDLRFTVVPSSVWVDSDPVLLSRLLRNLLSNAIKFTESGRILFGARRIGGGARIEVWDTGIGITPDQQRRIFDEYYQVDDSSRDQAKGHGLGLSVVQRTAKLLGHSVSVRSTPGRGSVFSVTTLPPPVSEASG